jgi:hypothetical protein
MDMGINIAKLDKDMYWDHSPEDNVLNRLFCYFHIS